MSFSYLQIKRDTGRFFLISSPKHVAGILLDVPIQGDFVKKGSSNEYSQHMFPWRNKKK